MPPWVCTVPVGNKLLSIHTGEHMIQTGARWRGRKLEGSGGGVDSWKVSRLLFPPAKQIPTFRPFEALTKNDASFQQVGKQRLETEKD